MPDGELSLEKEFWRFSLAFYESPGVAPALLALQDRDGCDVNLMLFALWLGISGRGRLNSDGLAAAARTVGGFRADIIEPLRALRRKLRDHPDDDVRRLREGVKALELEGEKLVQTRLARLAGPAPSGIPQNARLAAAVTNFSLYLGPSKTGREATIIRDALAKFVQPDGNPDPCRSRESGDASQY